MRDRGIEFSQAFTITFSYELKSFGGINPKAAMIVFLIYLETLAIILLVEQMQLNFLLKQGLKTGVKMIKNK